LFVAVFLPCFSNLSAWLFSGFGGLGKINKQKALLTKKKIEMIGKTALSCKIKWQHTGKHRSTSLQLTLPDS
jgi:hypothetical protein